MLMYPACLVPYLACTLLDLVPHVPRVLLLYLAYLVVEVLSCIKISRAPRAPFVSVHIPCEYLFIVNEQLLKTKIFLADTSHHG